MRYFLILAIVFIVSCDNFNRDDFSMVIPDNSEKNDDFSDPDISDELSDPDIIQFPDESEIPDETIEPPDTNTQPDMNETPDEISYDVYEVTSDCRWCGRCVTACSVNAISNVGGKAVIDPAKCTGCGDCVYRCPRGAIRKKE